MSNGHGPTSSPSNASATTIKPTDLRGILQYVPRFQGQIFVIAIDGSIVADENFANLIVDIAVLRSLGIKIVLVHGIGHQLRELSVMREIPLSNVDGSGVTDEAWVEAARHYDDAQLLTLVGQISVINAFNRMNVLLKQAGGGYVAGHAG